MTRLHYGSRSDSSRRGGQAYRGVSSRRPAVARPQLEVVPAGPDLFRCPVCSGHVKLVNAPYTNLELGIRYGSSKVLASHVTGGAKKSAGHAGRCIGSLTLPTETRSN